MCTFLVPFKAVHSLQLDFCLSWNSCLCNVTLSIFLNLSLHMLHWTGDRFLFISVSKCILYLCLLRMSKFFNLISHMLHWTGVRFLSISVLECVVFLCHFLSKKSKFPIQTIKKSFITKYIFFKGRIPAAWNGWLEPWDGMIMKSMPIESAETAENTWRRRLTIKVKKDDPPVN